MGSPSIIQWPEHRNNGGTGVTKASPDAAKRLRETVEKLNDPEVFMKDDELHTTRERFDLSDYWKLYDKMHGSRI